jgi:hypothetical protein
MWEAAAVASLQVRAAEVREVHSGNGGLASPGQDIPEQHYSHIPAVSRCYATFVQRSERPHAVIARHR